MERHEISRIAHHDHPIAAPLSDGAVHDLLARLLRGREDGRLLDLGCGESPWLVRALAAHPALRAVGVDADADALRTVLRTAQQLGVDRRIGLHHRDAREFSTVEPFDAALCIGATRTFGGIGPALAAIGPLLAPGGAVLLGEPYREREPAPLARESAAAGAPDLAGTVAAVRDAGWLPVAGHTSTRTELDAYAWARTGSLTDWALDRPPGPDRDQALLAAADDREQWLGGQREALGFVTLVLRRSA
ncbi:SAM-dependent methyltransferase [Kitasatospora phosalacinea]|uniref:SAM-dependent methyltransferase n=1 Tax=Kitasatospora phosalacinea TaxID=2065 RepID=UPI0035D862D5